jgi:hypothetical protein
MRVARASLIKDPGETDGAAVFRVPTFLPQREGAERPCSSSDFLFQPCTNPESVYVPCSANDLKYAVLDGSGLKR